MKNNFNLPEKLTGLFLAILLLILICVGCNRTESRIVMTVSGPVPSDKTGSWLPHEHILVDFIGADSISPGRYNREKVIARVLPFLKEVKKLGCSTFVDCTPEYLGRDALLLRALADSTGLNILTNTGLYGAHDDKYIPHWAFSESAESLSKRWIEEWNYGIDGTGIKPGFIKIAVGKDSLSSFHRTLVKAAALTHLATGLTIASHTGPALPAFQEIEILEKEGVSPEAFIWVHANIEKDLSRLADAARKGAWISLDKLNDDNVNELVGIIKYMKKEELLGKVLLSHDAGWYDPAKENGGDYRGYTTLYKMLIPELEKKGFSESEIRQMTRLNPALAYSIRIRKLKT